MLKLKGGDLGLERTISVDHFREFCRTHPAVLYPAFVLQTQMQEKILGSKFWNACSETRVELSSGKYISISTLLHAHVNEQVGIYELLNDTNGAKGGGGLLCAMRNISVKGGAQLGTQKPRSAEGIS